MRLYLDASALVKVFVDEQGRDEVLAAVAEAELAATARLGYVECRAAFARARREGRLSETGERVAGRSLDQRWSHLAVVELDEALMRQAADLTRAYALRSADAVHLASAIVISGARRNQTTFACWDRGLSEAAEAAGFATVGGT